MQTRGIPDNQYSPRKITQRRNLQWRLVGSNGIDKNSQVIQFYLTKAQFYLHRVLQY